MTWLIAKHVGRPALCFAFKQTMDILSWANVGDPARFKVKHPMWIDSFCPGWVHHLQTDQGGALNRVCSSSFQKLYSIPLLKNCHLLAFLQPKRQAEANIHSAIHAAAEMVAFLE